MRRVSSAFTAFYNKSQHSLKKKTKHNPDTVHTSSTMANTHTHTHEKIEKCDAVKEIKKVRSQHDPDI